MTKKIWVGAAALVAGALLAGTAFAGKSLWDDRANADLKDAFLKMHGAWEKGDTKTVRSLISTENFGSAWDLDMFGKPISWSNADAVVKFAEEMNAQMKKMGATSKMTLAPDCKVSGNLGFCHATGELTLTIPKMPPATIHMRTTEIAVKEKDGWKFVHHHGSLAKDPMGRSSFVAWNANEIPWMPAPGMGDMKVAPVWMNPATGGGMMFFTVPTEVKQPRHIHPVGMTALVLEGEISTTDPATGKEKTIGPGGVFYRAANEIHTTSMKPGTKVFAFAEGPVINIEVDEKGKPVPPKGS